MFLTNRNKLQINQSALCFFLLIFPAIIFSQTNYLQQDDKGYLLLKRLEIKSGYEDLQFSADKPYSRKAIVEAVQNIDSLYQLDSSYVNLSAVDRYNMQRVLMNNMEWAKPQDYFYSNKPILNTFYKTKANFIEYNSKDLFLTFNPILQFSYGKDSYSKENLFQNTRGVAVRGMIAKKVGFNLYLTENQERDPFYVQQWVAKYTALPGAGFYKTYKVTAYDYFDARGAVSWNIAKFIDMQFGYDKNFIGSGFRTLFLSDFSNSALYFKINTRIWKLNYENLFFELYPQHGIGGGDALFPRKYARMNHLSINATKWLNVGLFESVVFGRKDHFDFQYLVPVMFIRPIEQQVGSADNAVVGFDAKVNLKKTIQLYGQLMLDEFILSEIKKNSGFWANKYGYQLGVKYVDAFKVNNLDLQLELNHVRPFTYSHFDSIGNYTHYNQPLAHPLGANFNEIVAIVNAQPIPRLYLQGKFIHYIQGLDSAGVNFGSNPLLDYNTRPYDYGFVVGSGDKASCNIFSATASYEFKENMYVDVSLRRRTYTVASGVGNNNTNIFSVAFRWNIAKREFDF